LPCCISSSMANILSFRKERSTACSIKSEGIVCRFHCRTLQRRGEFPKVGQRKLRLQMVWNGRETRIIAKPIALVDKETSRDSQN
jgi:hypothetical protein